MRRREFIALAAGAVAAWPLAALAQQAGRTYRLGVMTGVARAAPRMVAFFDELKVQGFVEGQNLEIVVDGFDLRDDQYAEVAATLTKAAPYVVFKRRLRRDSRCTEIVSCYSYRGFVRRFGGRWFCPLAGPSRWQHHWRR
jgi:hypothetical protein